MTEEGVDSLSRTMKKPINETNGVIVKPGTYRAALSFGDQVSEQTITIKSDPRFEVSQKSINEVYDLSKQLETMSQTIADAVKQLNDSKAIANEYSKRLISLDKNKYKDDIKTSKDIVKQIDEIIAIYFGKEEKRQGITRNPEVNVTQRLSNAVGYVTSRKNGITTTELTLVKHAKDAINKALENTNTFFNDNWKPYQTKMETLNISPFKETKSYKLD